MQVHINFAQAIADVQREFRDLAPQQVERAIASALNKTAAVAKTKASREIRAVWKISARAVRDAIAVRKASANAGTLAADVNATGRPLPALGFSARQTKKGVTINVKRARKTIPGAFILTMRSGHQGVFARVRGGVTYEGGELAGRRQRIKKSGPDLPIGEVRTLGVPRAFGNAIVIRALEAKAAEHFPPTLAAEMRWRSSRA